MTNTLDQLMSMGIAAWRRFVRSQDDDRFRLEKDLGGIVSVASKRVRTQEDVYRELAVFSARWCHYGFPIIDVDSHKYAAALACTDVTELVFPWPVFIVRIPPTILVTTALGQEERGDVSIRVICVEKVADTPCSVQFTALPGDGFYTISLQRLDESSAVVFAKGDFSSLDQQQGQMRPDQEQRDRMRSLVMRIAMNAALTLSEHRETPRVEKTKEFSISSSNREPIARRFTIGQTVHVDVRDAVRDYIQGTERDLRKIQWLVRGHWRNQPHGRDKQLRRKQWIEPHWAKREGAPDDAPIPLRSHTLK